MSRRDVVVIGASAGGLAALEEVLSPLPRDLDACLLLVLHTSSNGSGALPEILSRVTALAVSYAETGDALQPGRIYVARPDFHLIVTSSGLQLGHGPRENGFRPAIDPLFRTAARELGSRVIGVILSGALADGAYGLSVIKEHGGIAIVQDPADAAIPSMPLNAIKYVDVDHVLRASDIGRTLEHFISRDEEREGGVDMPRRKDELEPQLRSQETEVAQMQDLFGPPSALTCPDCGGALWEVQEGRLVRYQCHVGHQYAVENLEEGQRDVIDGALWSAVRALEEHAALKMRLADRAVAGGLTVVSQGFAESGRKAHEQAQLIRAVLFDMGNGKGDVKTGTQPRAVARATAARAKSRPRKRSVVATRRKPRSDKT